MVIVLAGCGKVLLMAASISQKKLRMNIFEKYLHLLTASTSVCRMLMRPSTAFRSASVICGCT